MKQDPIVILGSGAMASFFAARLLAAGQPVAMLDAWEEALQKISGLGLRLVNSDGHLETFHPLVATADPNDCPSTSLALVLVKSWQTEQAARQLRQVLTPDGLALSLQNGLGNLEKLAAILGAERVAAGATTYGATLLEAGLVRPEGEGEIALEQATRLSGVYQRLHSAGFKLRRLADLESLLWGKLLVNAAVNPTTALLGVPNGALLKYPYAWAIAEAALLEACQVSAAQNIRLPYTNPRRHVRAVIRKTAGNHSSMLQDLRRGAPTEIEAINGAIVRCGAKFGLETPVNRLLVWLVQARLATLLAAPSPALEANATLERDNETLNSSERSLLP